MCSRRSGRGSSWNRKTERLTLVGAAALALALVAGTGHHGPNGQRNIVDSGTFTLYVAGVRIGEEVFVIRRERAGSAGTVYRAGAELKLKLDGETMSVKVALEALGPSYRPLRYEAEVNGSRATVIVGSMSRRRWRLDIRSSAGNEMKEFLVRENVAVLDQYVAHQYFFASKLIAGSASVEASVIVPRQRHEILVELVDRGVEPMQVGPDEQLLHHIAIVAESGNESHVWMDGDRVMKVEVPELEFVAVRSGDTRNTSH